MKTPSIFTGIRHFFSKCKTNCELWALSGKDFETFVCLCFTSDSVLIGGKGFGNGQQPSSHFSHYLYIDEVEDGIYFRVPEPPRPLVESSRKKEFMKLATKLYMMCYGRPYPSTQASSKSGQGNGDFARFLLDNAKTQQEQGTNTTSISEDTRIKRYVEIIYFWFQGY